VIVDALAELGVEVRTGVALGGYDGTTAQLTDGATVDAQAVVWTGGMRASDLTAQVPGRRDRLGRLAVDQQLRAEAAPGVLAAGDTAAPLDEAGRVVIQSCQHAMPQGTCAGHNAVADLLGRPLVDLETRPYQTCLDLGPAGAVATGGWDREIRLTGAQAKELKRTINTRWIYPSVGHAAR
jgi:NADH dehydrogenase